MLLCHGRPAYGPDGLGLMGGLDDKAPGDHNIASAYALALAGVGRFDEARHTVARLASRTFTLGAAFSPRGLAALVSRRSGRGT